jgi:hypothetical protein
MPPGMSPAGSHKETLMHNVSHKMDGDRLVITIDIGAAACQAAPRSGTGKRNLVATTSGFLEAKSPPGFDVAFSLNVTALAKALPVKASKGQRQMVDQSERDRRKVAKLYRSGADTLLP